MRKPHKLSSVSCFLFESPLNCALKCSTGSASQSTAPLLTPHSSLLRFFFRSHSICGCFLPPTPKITTATGLLQPSDVSRAGRGTRCGAFLAEQSRRQQSTRAAHARGHEALWGPSSHAPQWRPELVPTWGGSSSRAAPGPAQQPQQWGKRGTLFWLPFCLRVGSLSFHCTLSERTQYQGEINIFLGFFSPFSVLKQLSGDIRHITLPEGVLVREERRAERMAEERAQGSGTESQFCYLSADIQHLTFCVHAFFPQIDSRNQL